MSAASSGLLFGTAGGIPTPAPPTPSSRRPAPGLQSLLVAIARAARARPKATLAVENLSALSPRQWATLRLQLQPGLGIVRVPAAAFARWAPGSGSRRLPTGQRWVSVLVASANGTVVVAPLPPGAPTLLRRLRRGEPLGRALADLPADAAVGSWLAEWRAAGLFATDP